MSTTTDHQDGVVPDGAAGPGGTVELGELGSSSKALLPANSVSLLPGIKDDDALVLAVKPPPQDGKAPLTDSSIFSRLTWSFMGPLLSVGAKKSLEVEDLERLPGRDYSVNTERELLQSWEAERRMAAAAGERPRLWRAFNRTYGPSLLVVGTLLFLYTAIHFAQPMLLRQVILFVAAPPGSETEWHGYAYAVGLGLTAVLQAVLHHQYYYNGVRIMCRARTAVTALLYRHSLTLRSSAFASTTVGQAVNLISNDAFRFEEFGMNVNHLWNAPLEAAIGLALLWSQVGVASLAGYGILFLVTPLQSAFARKFMVLRKTTLGFSDERVRAIGELLVGAEVMKLYGWEEPLQNLVDDLRVREMNEIRKASRLRAFNLGVYGSIVTVVSLATFAVYVFALGNTLDPATVFTTVALYSVCRTPISWFWLQSLERTSDMDVAIKRMEQYLLLGAAPGTTSAAENKKDPPESSALPPGTIVLEDADFSWDLDAKATTDDGGSSPDPLQDQTRAPAADAERPGCLRGLNLRVGPGELVAVVGPIGSGKSSLLAAVLGEMSGHGAAVSGRVSYAPQKAWILAATVRENITFGRPMDWKRYQRTLEACQLEPDLKIMENGDLCLVGERGVTLSGGQQARVSLARAVYADADVVLLDDPLSAVDALVARRLFDRVLGRRGVLRKRTRVLVTHQTQFLGDVDRIVVMDGGRIVASGTLDELRKSGFDINSILHPVDRSRDSASAHSHEHSISESLLEQPAGPLSGPSVAALQQQQQQQQQQHQAAALQEKSSGAGADSRDANKDVIKAEGRELGDVPWSLYWQYFRGGNAVWRIAVAAILMVGGQAVYVVSDWWLARWSTASPSNQRQESIIVIYSVLVAATMVMMVWRAAEMFGVAIRSSIHLHSQMFRGVLYASMRFFESNPVGRVLNRFSKDQSAVDEILPVAILDVLTAATFVVASVVLVLIVTPWTLIFVAPASVIFFKTRTHYVTSARSIKRLESTTSSPIFSHYSSSLQGLPVLRAFRAEERSMRTMHEHLDVNMTVYSNFLWAGRWAGYRIDTLAALLVLVASVVAVASRKSASASLVGLSLSYTLGLTALVQWMIRRTADVENFMTSTERIAEYGRLPPEGERHAPPERRPEPGWPMHGRMSVHDLELRYRPELPLVLRGLSFEVPPRAKVGVCGRTGAGKSSLFASFFRLVEPCGGRIEIDGVDIGRIGLADLRCHLAIIPQRPVLFSGTLRYNLDPFREHTDRSIWLAVEAVQLGPMVTALPKRLDTMVAEYGGNLSVGEAQLVCVARALLRASAVLFVDEATASVDKATDQVIQRVIRERFSDRTVVTIAHRLETIADSDYILVMDAGRAAEFGPPDELLQRPDGIFRDMALKAGLLQLPGSSPTHAATLNSSADDAAATNSTSADAADDFESS